MPARKRRKPAVVEDADRADDLEHSDHFDHFERSLIRFLGQLKRNNHRDWFQRNKDRYEAEVREPTLAFIRAMAPRLERISPSILADDSRSGGSMMRPYRDTRFSSSKQPYKTNVGVQFRHEAGCTAHAPGFWLHIAPGEFWLAVGMWRPEPAPLDSVRRHIAEHSDAWLAVRDDRAFRAEWEIVGDGLQRPPRGFDPDHPLVEDLKRKEFLGLRDLGPDALYEPHLPDRLVALYAVTKPYMRFLCEALGLWF